MNEDRTKRIESDMDALGVRDIYDELIRDGQSPNMSAMLAAMRPPGVWNTDSNFNRRENDRMKALNDDQLDDIVRIAKRAGISTHGKSYNGQLGKYNDPAAWVANTNDVKNSAIAKGMDIDGMVKVKAYRGQKKKPRLGDLIQMFEGKDKDYVAERVRSLYSKKTEKEDKEEDDDRIHDPDCR